VLESSISTATTYGEHLPVASWSPWRGITTHATFSGMRTSPPLRGAYGVRQCDWMMRWSFGINTETDIAVW